jgi:hypothetical protein
VGVMTNTEALQLAISGSNTALFNNGTTDVKLQCTYPTSYDVSLDSNLVVDLLIEASVQFASGLKIEVLKNSVSLGVFTISSDTKAFYLSTLIGGTREKLSIKTTEELELIFTTPQLIKTKLITALDSDFVSVNTLLSSGLSSNMFLIHETLIDPSDENVVLALRNVMDNSKCTVTGNGTNVITIKNEFPIMGTALSKTLCFDALITFYNVLPFGTDIYIKKNGSYVKTVTVKSSINKSIWLSTLLDIPRELLYTKVNEEYELDFVYNQTLNVKLLTGELSNFGLANIIASQPSNFGLFQLADSNSFSNIPVSINKCNFIIDYEDYAKVLKSAVLQINDAQSMNIEYVTDNTVSPSKKYVRIHNIDSSFNMEIELLLDIDGLKTVVDLLRDFGRGING